ncbi:MAG: hypothetical protein ACI4JQ_09345, partial [Ruminococcus sp.]
KEEVAPILPDVENVPDEEVSASGAAGDDGVRTKEDIQDIVERLYYLLAGIATAEDIGISEEEILVIAQMGCDACDYFYQHLREEIDGLVEEKTIDLDLLWLAYDTLLSMRVDEYIFKSQTSHP